MWVSILDQSNLHVKILQKGRLIVEGKRPIPLYTLRTGNGDVIAPRWTRRLYMDYDEYKKRYHPYGLARPHAIVSGRKITFLERFDLWEFNTSTLESRCTIMGGGKLLPTRRGHAILLLLLAKIANGPRDDYWESCVELYKESDVPFEKIRKATNLAVMSDPFKTYHHDLFLKELALDMIDHPQFQKFKDAFKAGIINRLIQRVGERWKLSREENEEFERLIMEGFKNEQVKKGSPDEFFNSMYLLLEKEGLEARHRKYLDIIRQMMVEFNPAIAEGEALFPEEVIDAIFHKIRPALARAIIEGASRPAGSFDELLVNINRELMLVQNNDLPLFAYPFFTVSLDKMVNKCVDHMHRKGIKFAHERQRLVYSRGRVRLEGNEIPRGLGKGWFGESKRHSDARGRACHG